MAQTSRLVIELDSRDAEAKAADTRTALEDAGLSIQPALDGGIYPRHDLRITRTWRAPAINMEGQRSMREIPYLRIGKAGGFSADNHPFINGPSAKTTPWMTPKAARMALLWKHPMNGLRLQQGPPHE